MRCLKNGVQGLLLLRGGYQALLHKSSTGFSVRGELTSVTARFTKTVREVKLTFPHPKHSPNLPNELRGYLDKALL